jgi:hypothetical protein
MLRRIPATLLVYLAIFVTTLFAAASWAAGPDDSVDFLMKPNQQTATPAAAVTRVKPAPVARTTQIPICGPAPVFMYPGLPVMKTKPDTYGVFPEALDCVLPQPGPGQWEMSAQVLFARVRGKVSFNPNAWYWGGGLGATLWYYNQEMGFTDILGLPAHQVVGEFTARYQFRPNWAARFSILGFEMNSTGGNGDWWAYGWGLQTKWTHYYSRLGLIYDALHNCKAKLSVFADWVHVDDTLSIGCTSCGYLGNTKWGKNSDAMIAGMELQRCMRTFANGGTFSLDCKAGGIFLDDIEGYDVSAGARYSVPLNCGRAGYAKGGYRAVELKKYRTDLVFSQALEGGFLEMGLIF